MSETEDSKTGVPEGAEEVTDVAEGGNGSGGSLFKRAFSNNPQDRAVKRLAFGSALVALFVAGLGVRRWRNRH